MLDAAKKDSYDRLGTTWRDLSLNNNNGTLTNFGSQTKWSIDNGGSIVFDGVNDFIDCGTVNSIGSNPANSFTISVWVKKNANGGGTVFEKYQGVNIVGIWGWIIRLDHQTTNDVLFYLNRSQQAESVILTNNAVFLNQWANITAKYDGSFGYLYVNGNFLASGATTGGSTSTRNFNLGITTVNNSVPLNGNISTVLGYTRALTNSEVLQNYNATKGRFGGGAAA